MLRVGSGSVGSISRVYINFFPSKRECFSIKIDGTNEIVDDHVKLLSLRIYLLVKHRTRSWYF